MDKSTWQGKEVEGFSTQNRLTGSDIMKHMAGPGVSLLIHLCILIVLGSIILVETPEKNQKEIQVEMKELKIPEMEKPEIIEIQPDETEIESPDIETEQPNLAQEVSDPLPNLESNQVKSVDVFENQTLTVSSNLSPLKIPVYGGPFGTTGDGGNGKGGPRVTKGKTGMLQGVFYDLKQLKNKTASGLGNGITSVMHDFVNGNWRKKTDKDGRISYPQLDSYYAANVRLWNSAFYIPVMKAESAPAAFHCEKEVKTGGWVAIYSGNVVAPFTGKFRFVGNADDVLVVRFNKKVVLDYGYTSFSLGVHLNAEHRKAMTRSPEAQQDILSRVTKLSPYQDPVEIYRRLDNTPNGYATGRIIDVVEGQSYPIEILISEIPGGIFHAALLVQELDAEGNPMEKDPTALPLFRTTLALPEPSTDTRYGTFTPYGPVWRVVSDKYRKSASARENDDLDDFRI